jgi:thiol:disulfide interchange protein
MLEDWMSPNVLEYSLKLYSIFLNRQARSAHFAVMTTSGDDYSGVIVMGIFSASSVLIACPCTGPSTRSNGSVVL